MPTTPKRIGVALSGGGYRAAAFHLGTLNKLNELQILRQVNVLSTKFATWINMLKISLKFRSIYIVPC